MLPVYDAIQFVKVLEYGGRTKPWLVTVKENDEIALYVIKIFSFSESQNRLGNEVLGNVLANQFNLNTPNAALIRLDEEFITSINDPQLEEILFSSGDLIKFGTKFLSPVYEYKPNAYSGQEIKKIVEIDSVFAFDILIRNGDRTNRRPNFLIYNKNGFVFDHELGFNIDSLSAQRTFQLDFSFKYHIFLPYLKSSWSSTKADFFNEFYEYLRYLNVSSLESYLSQMVGFGVNYSNADVIVDYLMKMKAKSFNFVNVLRGIIR